MLRSWPVCACRMSSSRAARRRATMLRLPPFRYEPASSVAAAVSLLAQYGPDALPVSGGTDLYANMKQRLFTPKVLVGLRPINELRFIRYNEVTGLTLGALATLTDIAESAVVRKYYPALAQAAALISTPQIRNMGTIGGNVCVDTRCNYYNQSYEWRKAVNFCMKKDGDICLVAPSSKRCWAVSSSDTAPMLWSLGASVKLAGPKGERVIPISALYQDDGIQYLSKQPGEVVTTIALPPADGWRSTYLKLRRRGSIDFPILGVAVALRMEGDTVREAAITLGAVASQPRPAPAAAALLLGQRSEE